MNKEKSVGTSRGAAILLPILFFSILTHGCKWERIFRFKESQTVEIADLRVMYDLYGNRTELKEWVYGDNLIHPDEFYLEVTIKNNGRMSIRGVKVNMVAEYKTGSTMAYRDYDTLDYEKLYSSERTEWSRTDYRATVRIEHIEPDQIVRVKTQAFDFKKFSSLFQEKNQWPTRLRFNSWLSLTDDDAMRKISLKSIELKTVPGD